MRTFRITKGKYSAEQSVNYLSLMGALVYFIFDVSPYPSWYLCPISLLIMLFPILNDPKWRPYDSRPRFDEIDTRESFIVPFSPEKIALISLLKEVKPSSDGKMINF